jgi:hypothetical protein
MAVFYFHRARDLVHHGALFSRKVIYSTYDITSRDDCSIDQAVSRRLPTAVARVQVQIRSCGICDGENGIVARFLCEHFGPTASCVSTDYSTFIYHPGLVQ